MIISVNVWQDSQGAIVKLTLMSAKQPLVTTMEPVLIKWMVTDAIVFKDSAISIVPPT